MKITSVMYLIKVRLVLFAGVLMSALPGMAWSHPGHGLDGWWAHNMLHTATAVLATALVAVMAVRFIRSRKQRKRS